MLALLQAIRRTNVIWVLRWFGKELLATSLIIHQGLFAPLGSLVQR